MSRSACILTVYNEWLIVSIQPILVAAAIDYEMVPGKRHGDIAKRVAEDVRKRRRLDAGLDQDSEMVKVLPTYKNPVERQQREVDGGIVIIGRPTFKEFMAGLQKGWSGDLEKVDAEEELTRELENDTHFDEPEDPRDFANHEPDPFKQSPLGLAQSTPAFSPYAQIRPSSQQPSPYSSPSLNASSIFSDSTSSIPPLPPLLLVPFTDLIGLKQIPLMIWGFFNQRHKVRSGAEAGYRLVMNNTRPIEVPDTLNYDPPSDESSQEKATPSLGDLDFDKEAEVYYKKSMDEFPDEVEENRKKYYDALPAKLATARELARGIREPTKDELENPPPTEVELRAERLKKEKRWRDDLEGWNIIKPSQRVSWDPRFKDALRVFVDPPEDDGRVVP